MIFKRNIGEELLEGMKVFKGSEGKRHKSEVPLNVIKIRTKLQSSFMGVTKKTLEDWEQGRRNPSGPACSLIRIAQKHPEVFKEI